MSTLVLLLTAFVERRSSGRWLWPPVVLGLLWALLFLFWAVFDPEIDPVSDTTRWLVVAGVVAFAVGGRLALRKRDRSPIRTSANYPRAVNLRAAAGVLIVLVLACSAVVPKLLATNAQSAADNLLASVNVANAEGELSFGGFLWLFRLLLAFTVFLVVRCGRERDGKALRKLTALSIVFVLLATTVFASRSMMLMTLVCVAFSAYISRVLSGRAVLLTVGVVFAVVFVAFGALRGHFGGSGSVESEALWSVLRNYALGSIAAFNLTVSSGQRAALGIHTFRSVCLWLNGLGVDVEVVPMIQEFVFVPFPVNVYTAFDPYYKDFGPLGVVLISGGVGFLTCKFFVKAQRLPGRALMVGMAAAMFYAMLMLFFDDEYFRQASNWVFFGAGLWLFDRFLGEGRLPVGATGE